jgi:hypothetical protein
MNERRNERLNGWLTGLFGLFLLLPLGAFGHP